MKITTLCVLSAFALTVTGCASAASGVAPVYIPASEYAAMDCATARGELAARRTAEAELARRQDTASRRDTAGVAIIGLPVGSLFRGDVSGQLAQVKGEALALERHIVSHCQN